MNRCCLWIPQVCGRENIKSKSLSQPVKSCEENGNVTVVGEEQARVGSGGRSTRGGDTEAESLMKWRSWPLDDHPRGQSCRPRVPQMKGLEAKASPKANEWEAEWQRRKEGRNRGQRGKAAVSPAEGNVAFILKFKEGCRQRMMWTGKNRKQKTKKQPNCF